MSEETTFDKWFDEHYFTCDSLARQTAKATYAAGAASRRAAQEEKPTHPVAVSVLLTNSLGQVLLAKRKNNTAAGLLSTPGGRLEKNETIYECATREFREECLAELGPVQIIAWREHFRYGNHYIMFYARATFCDGEIKNGIPDKSDDWAWHDIGTLNAENCTEPNDVLGML